MQREAAECFTIKDPYYRAMLKMCETEEANRKAFVKKMDERDNFEHNILRVNLHKVKGRRIELEKEKLKRDIFDMNRWSYLKEIKLEMYT